MGDRTRDQDLKELYHAKEGRGVSEREKLDKIMHSIREQGQDQELVKDREQLVKAVRNSDVKSIRRISEDIKVRGYKKGERNG